jgi:hypothetical protein
MNANKRSFFPDRGSMSRSPPDCNRNAAQPAAQHFWFLIRVHSCSFVVAFRKQKRPENKIEALASAVISANAKS